MDWLLSADNHIVEPEDMFIKRLPKNLRERAPRYVNEGGNIVAYVDGVIRQVIPEVAFGTEMWPEKNDDIPARLEMLERDGVWGEAILGNLTGVVGMCIEEPDFAMACARAYNDWLVETFEPYRDRVVGHAFIPVCTDPKDSVAEVERAAAMGLRSIIIPLWPPEPYYMKKFDPIWEAAAAHKMPVCMHAHTGRWFRKLAWGDLQEPEVVNASGLEDPRDRDAVITSGGGISFPQQGFQCYKVSGWFIGSGMLDRHPDLRLVFVECGSAWLLSASEWLDDVWRRVPGADRADGTPVAELLGGNWQYPLAPSEYLHRQVHITFQDEPTAVALRDRIGIDALMWGQDHPHNEGTWPHTREVTEKVFAGVPKDEVRAMTGGTAARLFGLKVPA